MNFRTQIPANAYHPKHLSSVRCLLQDLKNRPAYDEHHTKRPISSLWQTHRTFQYTNTLIPEDTSTLKQIYGQYKCLS